MYLPTRRFRQGRMLDFVALFRPTASMRILDVGGTSMNWRLVRQPAEVVLLNIVMDEDPQALPPRMRIVQGDGTKLPFGTHEFDVCFSNSVIEHVSTYERQQAFAAEIRRVGKGIWLQTPARSFPLEPHWLGFGIHWLPHRWQRRLARNFTLYGLITRPSRRQVDELVDEYRLLSHREMRELFPDCEIRRERLLGLTKSYVAVRLAARAHDIAVLPEPTR
jgi:hypothetical protein